jgi:FkbM family methyltransferase
MQNGRLRQLRDRWWPTKRHSDADRTPLKVLITNITLAGRSGTEIVIRDLAIGLLERGHRPLVYSPIITGPIAEELRASSVPVVDNINSIDGPVDIIHGHHTPTTATAIARFPNVPAIFVCHDFVSWHDAPPQLPQIRRCIAVDRATSERLAAEGFAPGQTEMILNAIDIRRLPPQPELPERPMQALLVAKGSGYADIVKDACDERAIALEVIGASAGRLVDDPETYMAGQHIVFASARSALEAMAAGCAVIACDARGLGGLVTTERLADWREQNFGLRTLQRQTTVEALVGEIDRYRAADAMAVSRSIRRDAAVDTLVSSYLQVYRNVIAEHRQDPGTGEATRRAFASHLERWSPRVDASWPWMREREWLLDEIHRLRENRKEAASDEEPTWLGEAASTRGIEWCDSGQYGAIAGVVDDEVLFTHIKAGRLWEPGVVALFESCIRPGSIAIDCGANIGVHSIAMAVRQPDLRRVIAFEPHPEIFKALSANARSRSKIDARQMALLDKRTTMTMLPLGNSSNPAAARLHDVAAIGAKVRTCRLDDLELENVSFIKVDVEGNEMQVIAGAERTIRMQRPALLVEIWNLNDPQVRRSKINQIISFGYLARQITDTHVLFTPT